MNSKTLTIYNDKLTKIGLPFKEFFVDTNYGKTNVLIYGNAKKTPLFLVHGLNSAAPFAIDNVSFLLKKYQIFAIDVLGQPNKSDFVRLNKKDASYGKWLLEIISFFKVDELTLCGFSFGAFPILKSLLIDETKVKEVFLISPAGIVNGNLWKTIFTFLMPMKKFQKTKKEVYLVKFSLSIYDEMDVVKKDFISEVTLNFKMDFSITPNFTSTELSTLKTPITIIASKNDFFVPALKLKRKCVKNITPLKKFVALENSKHIPSKKVLEKVFNHL